MGGPLRTTNLTITLIGIGEIDSVPDWEGTTSSFFEGAYDEELPDGVIDVAVGVTATRVEVFRGSGGDAAVEVTYIQEAWYLADDPDWAPGDDFALVPLSTESRRDDYVFRLRTLDGYEGLTDVLEIDASVAVTRDVGAVAVAGGEEGSGGGGGVATMGVIVGISVFVGVLLLAAIVAGIARHRRGRHDDDWLGSNADKGRHDGGDHEESPPTSTLEYPTGRQQDVRAGSVSFGGGAGRPTGGADWSLLGDDNVKPQTSAQEYHPLNNYDVPPTSKGQDVRTESKPSSTPSTLSTLSISQDTPTIGTVDYDYGIAYGGGADHSLSDAGGTVSSRTRQTCPDGLEEGVPTMPPPGSGNAIFSDDPTFDRAYEEMREVLLDVYAPAGRLGVIIDTPDDGAPVIHAIKEDSLIFDKVRVGDKLVAVDDEDVRAMTAVKVSKMISTKGNNPSRKFTIIRQERKT